VLCGHDRMAQCGGRGRRKRRAERRHTGTGGVSLFALQIARLMGANIILISSSDEKLEIGRKLGATHLINYRATPDWYAKVVDYTNGGADLIVEIGGADILLRSIRAVSIGGHISVIGVRSGFGQAPGLPLEEVLFVGFWMPGVGQNLAIALAIFTDPHPEGQAIYPRWIAYLNLWVAVSFAPGLYIGFFHKAPLAWHGVLGLWMVAVGFFLWAIAMWRMTLKAIDQV